jgi:high-affinity iron transporter
MLAALLIVFREVVEAGLIVGIVLAATEGVAHRRSWIAGGVAGGLLGAALVAAFAQRLLEAFSGSGQEVFNAAILGAATLLLGWHTVWMARHGRELSREMKSLGSSVASGDSTLLAMAIVVAIAILREGSEVALFLFGIAASGGEQPAAMLAGGMLGVAAGALLSWLIYRGLLAIPTGKLFSVTNWLVALLAAGMAGQATVFLANANLAPTLGAQLWDTSQVLSDASLPGRALHALVGYSDRPMGLQVLTYLVVLGTLVILGRVVGSTPAGAGLSHRRGRRGLISERPARP